MKVYITKYALSEGITIRETRESSFPVDGVFVRAAGQASDNYIGRNDWFPDYQSALARAEKLRADKIASLKKQLEKLEKMTFSDPAEGETK